MCNQEAAGAGARQHPHHAHSLFALQAGKPRDCPRRRVVKVRWAALELSSPPAMLRVSARGHNHWRGRYEGFVARPSYMKVS